MRAVVRPSAIARACRGGPLARGFQMAVAVPAQIEFLAGFGFDFVFLDAEHGTFTLTGIEDCCRAAEVHELTVIARVPGHDTGLIAQFLNAGMQGIVVPHVDTVDQACALIAACRYAPQGLRPSGGARSNAFWRGVTDMDAALAEANAQVTLSVQIESVEGLAALPGMLALGGIDYITIGKQDLAQSMGFARLAKGFPPQVLEATAQAEALVRAAGVRMKDDVMAVARVNAFLAEGARAFLAGARA